MLRQAIRRLSGHTLTYAVAEMASRLAGFLLMPLVTDHLSLAEYGTREVLSIVLVLLSQVAGIHVASGMSRLYFEESAEARRGVVVSTTLWAAGGMAVVVTGLLWLTTPWAVRLFGAEAPDDLEYLFHLMLLLFAFQMLREVLSKVLQTLERSRQYVGFALTKLALEIGLQIYFLVALERGLAGLFEALVLTEALFAVLLALVILPGVGLGFSRPVLAALAVFTLPLIPNGLLQFGLHNADRFLLLRLSGEDAVGVYGFAYKLGQLPNFALLGPFLLIWYPYVFSLRDSGRQRILIERLTPYFMGLMSGVTLLTALFSPELVALAGSKPEYHQAWPSVPLIALGYWSWGLFQVVQTGFYIQKRTGPLPRLTLFALVVDVTLNLVMVPALGALGAAIATAVTFFALAAATVRLSRQVFPLDMEWKRILTPLAGACVALAVGLLLAPRVGGWSLPLKAGCALGWLAWTWAGGLLERHERKVARELVASVPGRVRTAFQSHRDGGSGGG